MQSNSEMPFGYVYLVSCSATPKRYIGITSRSVAKRWKRHLWQARGRKKTLLHRAISKYGPSSFSIEILEECPDRPSLNAAERRHIRELGTIFPLGYNLTEGGEGTSGYLHSDETKIKVSIANKGRKRSAEAIQRSADANRGRKRSQLTRSRLSAANKGNRPSPETIEAARAVNTGRIMTEGARAAISRAVVANYQRYDSLSLAAAGLGVTMSTISRRILREEPGYLTQAPRRTRAKRNDAQKAAMRERTSLPVIANGVRYPSLTEAALALGVSRPAIAYRLKTGRDGYSLL